MRLGPGLIGDTDRDWETDRDLFTGAGTAATAVGYGEGAKPILLDTMGLDILLAQEAP